MKIEHIAVAANSERDCDKFFIELLGMKKARSFSVSADLMSRFFGVHKDQNFIKYENENFSIEVIITADNSKAKDIFTHSCLSVKDKDFIIQKAQSMSFPTIKVPRKDSKEYYLFVKDYFGNLYEIK
jgi:hypothetical protein